ncbi:MAG TPA: DUF502 domain-containing protein [Candidatus Hydrogenedentes bacterium]|nr:DUF502 domain-containing protein [Candidatus Hydrogenedentota bacterium]
MNTPHVKPALTAAGRFWATLRKPLISGLLVVVPAGITLFVMKFLYSFTAGRISPLIRSHIEPIPDYISPVVACLVLFLFVYGTGMVAGRVAGRKLIRLAEALITRIPLVKTIYIASKQVVRAVAIQKKGGEPKVPVVVDFPCRGMKAIGFAVGRVRIPGGRDYFRVFIPTTPNISVGLLQLVPVEDVYHCGLTLDEAVKTVVSVGILGPDRLVLTPAAAPACRASAEDDDDDDDFYWDDDED